MLNQYAYTIKVYRSHQIFFAFLKLTSVSELDGIERSTTLLFFGLLGNNYYTNFYNGPVYCDYRPYKFVISLFQEMLFF